VTIVVQRMGWNARPELATEGGNECAMLA